VGGGGFGGVVLDILFVTGENVISPNPSWIGLGHGRAKLGQKRREQCDIVSLSVFVILVDLVVYQISLGRECL
jgi:hypothetical protein